MVAFGLVRFPKLYRSAGAESAVGAGFDGQAHIVAVQPRAFTNVIEAYAWAGLMKNATGGADYKGTGRFAWHRQSGALITVTPGTGSTPVIVAGVYTNPPAIGEFFATGVEVTCTTRYVEHPSVTSDLWVVDGFRTIWNSTMPGEFILMMPDVQITQAVPGNERITMAGLKLLQRPDRINRTSTQLIVWDPVHSPSLASTFFPRTASDFPVRRWRYKPSEFDGLTGVYLRTFCGIAGAGGSRSMTWRLQTGDPNGSATTVYSQTVTHAAPPAGLWTWQSDDLRSLLVEDQVYWWEVSVSHTDFINTTPKVFHAWMDFEQQANFGRTTTYFGVLHGKFSSDVTAIPPNKWFITGDLIAPQDFQKIDDVNFVRPVRQWSNARRDVSNLIQVDMRTKRYQEEDGNRDCAFSGSPDEQHMNGAAAHSYSEDFLNNGDELPFNCLGDRHLYGELKFSWSSGGGIADHHFALTYPVPNEPTPALGDLFPLDAFNPEGCAATAAGGGVPGILLIANGSGVPKKFVPYKPTDQIEDAGIPAPFIGEESKIENASAVNSTAISPTGGLNVGTYRYRYTLRNCCTGKESDPSLDITIDTSGASPRAVVDLSFAGVRVPGDPQVCEICIYRTVVDGFFPVMAKVGCIDINTSPLLFIDDLGDDQLNFLNDPLITLSNPPPCVPYITSMRRRIWGCGDIPLLSPAGTVSVQNGDDIVIGDFDVLWDRCLEGKYIQVEGECRFYQIDRVLPPEDGLSPPLARLQLVESYVGQTRTGAAYIVCGEPSTLYFSEPEEPECWPVVNTIRIEPGDGDFCTGISSSFNALIITKRSKTYALSYRDHPALEGQEPTRISPDIGCVGPRTFTQVENATVWLADRGIALFDGRGVQHLPVSDDISDIFTDPDNPLYMRRNSRGIVLEAVAVNYPAKQQYWLGIPTVRSNRGFDLVIVWDYKEQTIFCYEFCNQFLSMVVGKDTAGNQKVYLGDDKGFLWVADTGFTDGAGLPGATGTLRGTVETVVDTFTFEDSKATFIEGGVPVLGDFSGEEGITPLWDEDPLGLAGVCIFFRNPGETEWVTRKIWLSSKQRIFFTPPMDDLLAGAEYMIAPIDFLAEFKPWNLGSDKEVKRAVDLFVIHEPEDFDSRLRVEFLADFEDEDRAEGAVQSDDSGVAGSRVFTLSHRSGKQKMALGRIVHTFQNLRLTNFAPEEPVRILNIAPTVTRHHGH
jgi:hypothetical protein